MFVDFKCTFYGCLDYNVEKTLSVRMADLDKQVCEHCGQPLKRVWNSNTSIRTSDGYKS